MSVDQVARGFAAQGKLLIRVNQGTANAGSNTTRINAALALGGIVWVSGTGVCYINAPLVIGSNTKLMLDEGLTLRQAAGANGNLLVTAAYNRGWNSATITWSAGMTATLTQTAHGYSIGDPVWVKGTNGTTDSAFCGVFVVQTVTDANNVVISLRRKPNGAATGTIQAKLADTDISILGGIWDYDQANNPSADTMVKFGLLIAGVRELSVGPLQVIRCPKYCLCLGAVADFRVDGLTAANTQSDALKVYGPAFDGRISNTDIRANGDDGISVQPCNPFAYVQYEFTNGGDILGCKITNTSCAAVHNMGAGAYAQPGFEMQGVVIDGVYGQTTSGNLVTIECGGASINGGSTAGRIRSITVRNVDAPGNVPAVMVYANLGTLQVDRLTIEGINGLVTPGASTQQAIVFGAACTIKSARVSGLQFYAPTSDASAVYVSGTVGEMVVENGYFEGTSPLGGVVLVVSGATVSKITVRDSEFSGLHQIVNISSGVLGTPLVSVTGCHGSTAQGVICSDNCDLYWDDNNISGATLGLIRAYKSGSNTPTISSRSGGGNLLTGGSIWLTQVNGAEIVSVFGFEIAVDVTKLARVNGAFCNNTNAAAGTLGLAGLIVCQGTAANSWKLVSDTTKAY